MSVGTSFRKRVILVFLMMNTQRTLGLVVGLLVVAAAAGVSAFMKPASRPRPAQPNAQMNSRAMPMAPVPSSTTTTVAEPTPGQATSPKPAAPDAPTVASYTSADVAKHNNESDCWSSINGKVYTLTDWIAQHPGGERGIIRLCGKDGSAAFNGQHGGQGQPMQALANLAIGTLK